MILRDEVESDEKRGVGVGLFKECSDNVLFGRRSFQVLESTTNLVKASDVILNGLVRMTLGGGELTLELEDGCETAGFMDGIRTSLFRNTSLALTRFVVDSRT